MASEGSEMTFWDHLEELRGTVFRSLSVFCIMLIPGLVFRNFLFDKVVMAPALENFFIYRWFHLSQNLDVVNLEISGQFMTHLKVCFILALILSCPYILYELWRFVAPALYEREKKGVRKAFICSSLLFYIGVAVGYFILLPVCLAFFQSYTVSTAIANTFSLQSYISMFGSMVLLVGLVFEFPILLYILATMGIIDVGTLRKGRKYAFVAILILSALITPADLGSMVIVALPLYALYELSIIAVGTRDDSKTENSL